jgi:hypothetical protein
MKMARLIIDKEEHNRATASLYFSETSDEVFRQFVAPHMELDFLRASKTTEDDGWVLYEFTDLTAGGEQLLTRLAMNLGGLLPSLQQNN